MQGSDNLELRRKFQRKQTFFREMEGISKKYFELEQQVYYAPIKDINSNMIVKIDNKEGKLFKREDYFLVNGQYQPHGERSFERLILQIVQTIPRPQKPFGVIYVNTLASSEAYNDFKKVMELLPFEYLSNLTKIYVLQPSFMSKAFFWLSFGTVTNYIKNKTVNADSLFDLSRESKFDIEFLKKTLPKNAVEELAKWEPEPEKQQIEVPKKNVEKAPQFRSLIRQPGGHEVPEQRPYHHMSQILTGSFEQPLKSNKKSITDYELGPTGAPIILELLIYFFQHREAALQVEGLFRKSVSIDDETEILGELDHKNYNYLQQVTDPHIIANALKRFLANFRVPLIPYDIFEVLMAREGDPSFQRTVIESIQKLPKVNKMTLLLLFNFLREKVLPYSQQSKMSENNLCIVFGPCLMRAEVGSIKDLLYARKIICATAIILREFEAIFGDEHSRNLLRRNSYVEYRKEDILQKLTPTKQATEGAETGVLDRTSDYVKDTLKEKDEADCYLDALETEQAIQGMPPTSESKALKVKKVIEQHIIEIATQEESIGQLQKQAKVGSKQKQHHFTQI